MKTKRAKDREIYDNYYVFEAWESAARENLEERGIADPSEEEMWNEVNALDQDFWEDVKCEMTNFFDDGSAWILSGTMERWNGKHSGHILFHTFSELLTKTAKDCDYYRFSDKNGHFLFQCSHHDGTNCFEIRKVTKAGETYYENWSYSTRESDNRSEWDVCEQIVKRYSTLPHFAHQVYGLPKKEFITYDDAQ